MDTLNHKIVFAAFADDTLRVRFHSSDSEVLFHYRMYFKGGKHTVFVAELPLKASGATESEAAENLLDIMETYYQEHADTGVPYRSIEALADEMARSIAGAAAKYNE